MLSNVDQLKWCVVDQKECVDAGLSNFQDDVLDFCETTEAAFKKYNFNVLLLGGVLQYLSSPYEIFEKLLEKEIKYVYLDRTPLLPGGKEKIMLQQTPGELGGDLHPIRILDEDKIIKILSRSYSIFAEYSLGAFPYKQSKSSYKTILSRIKEKY